jgi:hypothetical protein
MVPYGPSSQRLHLARTDRGAIQVYAAISPSRPAATKQRKWPHLATYIARTPVCWPIEQGTGAGE